MNIPVSSRYTFNIRTDAATLMLLPPDNLTDDRDQSDPDILIYRNGQIQNVFDANGIPQGLSGDANQEVFTTLNTLAAGDHVFDFNEFRYEDEQSPDPPKQRIDIEKDAFGPPGWYNEIWVMSLIYDLWDSEIDVGDIGSMGFGPIYDVKCTASDVLEHQQ